METIIIALIIATGVIIVGIYAFALAFLGWLHFEDSREERRRRKKTPIPK